MKKWLKISLSTVVLIALLSGSFYLGNKIAIDNGEKVVIDKEEYDIFSNLDSFKDIIDEYYLFDIKDEDLKTSTYKGFFNGLGDPYTEYMTEEEYEKLVESSSGEYSGIGVYITVTDDNLIKVISPIKGSPAFNSGIQPGDIIAQVNGETFTGDQLNDAMAIMKGKPGDKVTIGIKRLTEDGNYEDLEIKITIDIVELKTVEYSKIDNLGYILISQFGEKTYDEFEEAFNSLKDDKVKGIILDLRNNPGGLKEACVEIADFLLPEGPIVKTIDKNGNEDISESDSKEENLPMVVLVNNNSASASEILAGAIQDYGKATIVGTTTYGKGLVQTLAPLKTFGVNDEGALKITIQEYFTPKDRKINEIGVKPDREVEMPDNTTEYGIEHLDTDVQLKTAIDILVNS
ncbi:MAG: S41 family peptidase [Miniphocaeibacter sp.]|uniref:S41 family peptidase n=1 Tax=Miniphocaeibacter sp. TaxID=3100973 RepID=UPI0017AEE889|nr:S41 family peptidase [Gallicola sp.]